MAQNNNDQELQDLVNQLNSNSSQKHANNMNTDEIKLGLLEDQDQEQQQKKKKDDDKIFTFQLAAKSAKDILKEAIPALCCFELQVLTISLINSYHIGHLNQPELLVAFGLGDVLSKILGYGIMKYLHMGLLSKCAQAYGYSSKQKPLIGVYYQRGLFVSGFTSIVISPLFFISDHILEVLGFEKEIAKMAGRYIWVSLPSFYAYTYYDATKSYLQSQNLFAAPMYMQMAQTVFMYFVSDYLINSQKMGLNGAAWAKNMADVFVCILIYIYCNKNLKIQPSWIEWNQSAFNKLYTYIKYAVTMGLAGYIQEFSFYILTIMAGHFTAQTDSASQIALSYSQRWHYNYFLGFHIVMINYLGSSIMAGFYRRARHIVWIGITLAIFSGLLWIFLILINKNIWAGVFTSIPSVQQELLDVVTIYLLVLFFDGIQLTFSGILKGVDKQKPVIKVYVIAYIIISLPLSYLLGFHYHKKLKGLYIGWLIGGIICTISFIVIYLYDVKWKEQFLKIQQRMAMEKYAVIKEHQVLENQEKK